MNSIYIRCCRNVYRSIIKNQVIKSFHSAHEPEYLEHLKPKVPVYPLLNVQIKGYDFTVLETFGSYVHKTAVNMGIEVEDTWATPNLFQHVVTYKPFSTITENEYDLKIYERNIQLYNLASYIAPVFIEVIQTSLPEGVNLSVHPHREEDDEIRYIPDLDLIDLKKQLEEMTHSKE